MKLMIGLPWYTGPDDNTFPLYFDHHLYYGALRERSLVRDRFGKEAFGRLLPQLPPLDERHAGVGWGEPSEEEWERLGVVEIAIVNRSRLSLVGKARELLAEDALEWGADYLFCWDADMQFPHYAFLQLWRAQQLVVGGLAFTARHPIHPVIYRMRTHQAPSGVEIIDGSDIILDYPRDRLITNEDIGGELAFGAGVVLFDTRVFREMPKPWFNSTGCGEDWFFCHRCSKFGIPRYVDTRVKTQHKEHTARWACEETYWMEREAARQTYVDLLGGNVRAVKGGVLQ